MNAQPHKQGFTLVELMMAMLAFSIMALIVGAVLVYTWLGYRDYNESLAMQRDAMIAMKIMAKEIRNSNIDEISGDADSLDFSDGTTRTNAFAFSAADIAVSPGVVLNSWTEPAVNSDSVDIAFSLQTSRGAYSDTYQMTIYPRNEP